MNLNTFKFTPFHNDFYFTSQKLAA